MPITNTMIIVLITMSNLLRQLRQQCMEIDTIRATVEIYTNIFRELLYKQKSYSLPIVWNTFLAVAPSHLFLGIYVRPQNHLQIHMRKAPMLDKIRLFIYDHGDDESQGSIQEMHHQRNIKD